MAHGTTPSSDDPVPSAASTATWRQQNARPDQRSRGEHRLTRAGGTMGSEKPHRVGKAFPPRVQVMDRRCRRAETAP